MSYATDHPEDDHELSRCWSAWLVAREVGDDAWLRFAINELRIAAMRAQENLGGVSPEQASNLIGVALG